MYGYDARRLGVALFVSALIHFNLLVAKVPFGMFKMSEADKNIEAVERLPILITFLQQKAVEVEAGPVQATEPTRAVKADSAAASQPKALAQPATPSLPASPAPRKLGLEFNPILCGEGDYRQPEQSISRPYVLKDIEYGIFGGDDLRQEGRVFIQLCILEDGRISKSILLESTLPTELTEKIRQSYMDTLFAPARFGRMPVKSTVRVVASIGPRGISGKSFGE